jgi:hypothetical protein
MALKEQLGSKSQAPQVQHADSGRQRFVPAHKQVSELIINGRMDNVDMTITRVSIFQPFNL